MVEEVKRYRTEMAAMVQDLKDKQDRMQILNEEKSKLNKNINRAMYTHRIMDITNQIGTSFALNIIVYCCVCSQFVHERTSTGALCRIILILFTLQ